MAWKTRTILSLLAFGVIGCGGNIIESASAELGDDTGTGTDGTEDEIGDVETGTSTSTDDGESSTASDTSTTEDESTTDDATTEDESTSEESTTTTEESTSEESTTDTVVDTSCQEPVSILINAIDYADVSGAWTETMSTLGEGMVMSMPQDQNEGVLTYDFEIPCDDTWHIWVRAIEQQNFDSFWARVDGEPVEWAIFELDCTDAPAEPVYDWKQLNWRFANADGCDYVEDPWVHDWGAGKHSLELGYRESWAVSRIWVSNTGGNPP
jgi:hypothetical protein